MVVSLSPLWLSTCLYIWTFNVFARWSRQYTYALENLLNLWYVLKLTLNSCPVLSWNLNIWCKISYYIPETWYFEFKNRVCILVSDRILRRPAKYMYIVPFIAELANTRGEITEFTCAEMYDCSHNSAGNVGLPVWKLWLKPCVG